MNIQDDLDNIYSYIVSNYYNHNENKCKNILNLIDELQNEIDDL